MVEKEYICCSFIALVWDKGTARPTKEDILASGLVLDIDAMLKNEDEIEPTESYRDDDGNDLPPEILFNLNSVKNPSRGLTLKTLSGLFQNTYLPLAHFKRRNHPGFHDCFSS